MISHGHLGSSTLRFFEPPRLTIMFLKENHLILKKHYTEVTGSKEVPVLPGINDEAAMEKEKKRNENEGRKNKGKKAKKRKPNEDETVMENIITDMVDDDEEIFDD